MCEQLRGEGEVSGSECEGVGERVGGFWAGKRGRVRGTNG